jgi:hypothetical protein
LYYALSRRQRSRVTSVQPTGLGWSHDAVIHLVGRGHPYRVRRSVFRTAGSAVTTEQAVLAAVLAAGERSVLSHGSAARHWGFTRFPRPERIDILNDRWSQPRLAGVRGHRTIWLPDDHRTTYRSVPVTIPERTLVDCCGQLSGRDLAASVHDGLRRKIVTLRRLARVVDEVPRSGRRCIVPMVGFLGSAVAGYDPGGSDPEVDLVAALVDAGFPRPAQQVRVVFEGNTMFLDVGWPDLRVGFEYDSLEFHEHRFHEDRDRLRRLKRAGWDVWPITKTTSRNEILAIATDAFARSRAAERAQVCESGSRGVRGSGRRSRSRAGPTPARPSRGRGSRS